MLTLSIFYFASPHIRRSLCAVLGLQDNCLLHALDSVHRVEGPRIPQSANFFFEPAKELVITALPSKLHTEREHWLESQYDRPLTKLPIA